MPGSHPAAKHKTQLNLIGSIKVLVNIAVVLTAMAIVKTVKIVEAAAGATARVAMAMAGEVNSKAAAAVSRENTQPVQRRASGCCSLMGCMTRWETRGCS